MRIRSWLYRSPSHTGFLDVGCLFSVRWLAHCNSSAGDEETARNGNGVTFNFPALTDAIRFWHSASKLLQSKRCIFVKSREPSTPGKSGFRENALSYAVNASW